MGQVKKHELSSLSISVGRNLKFIKLTFECYLKSVETTIEKVAFYLSDPSWLTQPVVKLGSGVTHPNFGFSGFAGMSRVGNEATFDI